MKKNLTNVGLQNPAGQTASFAKACVESCRTILAQLRKAKDFILSEARATVEVHDQMLQLAVNEAEAVAWQTPYPHLLFPTLATEKVSKAAAWNSRQRIISRRIQ